MEFVDGCTLGDWHQENPDDFDARLEFALQIAEGINCAHKNTVIHRDIKPDNIMINRDNIVKITDFGRAKR